MYYIRYSAFGSFAVRLSGTGKQGSDIEYSSRAALQLWERRTYILQSALVTELYYLVDEKDSLYFQLLI